jgi:hypothetical protein
VAADGHTYGEQWPHPSTHPQQHVQAGSRDMLLLHRCQSWLPVLTPLVCTALVLQSGLPLRGTWQQAA